MHSRRNWSHTKSQPHAHAVVTHSDGCFGLSSPARFAAAVAVAVVCVWIGQGYGSELQSGLITLQKENCGTMVPDPLYSAYHHSHPPILQRLRAIEQAKATLANTQGKKAQ